MFAAAVWLLTTTEAFNPFACDCKTDKKGGGKTDNGLPPVVEAEVTCMCCFDAYPSSNNLLKSNLTEFKFGS